MWEALLRLRPEDVGALLARGELAAEAGGPQAAQPYDRRAVEAGADTLTTAQRLRLKLRLGHAALASGALQDAADALEEVVAQDAEGERGSQALSLLAEVYARRQDAQGGFRTSSFSPAAQGRRRRRRCTVAQRRWWRRRPRRWRRFCPWPSYGPRTQVWWTGPWRDCK